MNLMVYNNNLRMRERSWGSLCAVNASKRPHRVQVKVQLLEEACGLAHGTREACKTFR